ncbi:MAG: type II toxin-antitoxin system Phd/YefM family antitoxin [Candidatus Methanoplasma sp.]|jgi:prevent-host-death family protein|nr:type II toxin-antitoxin system Phd/YefM family antitoxin [Candidatus Methanoplasma sp.]
MVVVNATNARGDLYGLIDKALEHELITITTKKGNAVLMSEEDWESIKETLYLLGDPDFLKDVEESRNAPDSDFEAWN